MLLHGECFGVFARIKAAVLVRIGPVEHLSRTRQHVGAGGVKCLAGLVLVGIRGIVSGLAATGINQVYKQLTTGGGGNA